MVGMRGDYVRLCLFRLLLGLGDLCCSFCV